MIQDRKDYQRQYYQANKERIKLKRLGKTDSDSSCLFGADINDSNSEDSHSLFHTAKESLRDLPETQHYAVEPNSTVEQVDYCVETEAVEKSNLVLSIAIMIFLAANTVFLVHEQTVFFLLKKYTLVQAIYFSILMESALLLLSFLASYVENKPMKVCYYALLAISIVVSSLIVCSSVEKRDQQEVQASEKIQSLKKQIITLERQESIHLANIEALDPEKYPSKRARLAKEFEIGIGTELSSKRAELDKVTGNGLVDGETTTMKWMRLLAIAWNVVLIHSIKVAKN